MKKIFIFFIIIFIKVTNVSAEYIIFVDNSYIQQYRGKIGRWELIESKDLLNFFAGKYKINIKDIYDVNRGNIVGDYMFIPYSADYLGRLQVEGKDRNTALTYNEDEFIWPVEDIDRITSTFGMRWGQFHNGIDLPKTKGTPVLSASDGMVALTGYDSGYGNSILIEGRNNLFTRYSHNSVLLVKKGEFVRAGQIIALLGSTGNSTGNHLHFEILYKNIPLNPLHFLPHRDKIEFMPFSKY